MATMSTSFLPILKIFRMRIAIVYHCLKKNLVIDHFRDKSYPISKKGVCKRPCDECGKFPVLTFVFKSETEPCMYLIASHVSVSFKTLDKFFLWGHSGQTRDTLSPQNALPAGM